MGRLWLAMTEQAHRFDQVEGELAALRASRSWRVTAPLRRVARWLDASSTAPPPPSLEGSVASRPEASNLAPTLPVWMQSLAPSHGAATTWYVDVTELARCDLRAGIQRVTKRLLLELLLDPPESCRIEPVRLASDGRYWLARRFSARFLGLSENELGPDVAVRPQAGDRFVGLDLCRDHAQQLDRAIEHLRLHGVIIAMVVYDMLPVTHPDWFPRGTSVAYASWLGVLARRADVALCISRETAAEFRKVCIDRRLRDVPVSILPMGSDLLPAPYATALPARAGKQLRVLSVGTVEPRKGYGLALDALESLWREGRAVEWVIVGKQGWLVEALSQRLRCHPEAGRRLHWLENADDRYLQTLYRESDLLLLASEGEGFGLPVAEAGRVGLPMLLRDLPVFREVAGDAATYFDAPSGRDLATALWRELTRKDADARARIDTKSRWPTWSDCAKTLRLAVELTQSSTFDPVEAGRA